MLRIPDPASAYSFLAKSLPFWLHVVYYRAMGSGHGFTPFPTLFDPVVPRSGIHHFCQAHNLKIRLEHSYGYEKFTYFYPCAHLILKAVAILSLAKLDPNRQDLMFIIEK